MSRVVPSKMMPVASQVGVDAFKDILVENVRVLPVGTNTSTAYTPTSINKIHWRIPAFANAMMDNSRSCMSFNLKTTATSTMDASSNLVPGNGLPMFQRFVIKSSAGLVIEDISEFDALTRLFTITSQEEDYRLAEGVYGTGDAPVGVGDILRQDGIVYTVKFNHGILDKKLASYLPLMLMDSGSGYAFDLELYLNAPDRCLKSYGTVTGGSYAISNPVMNLALLRLDEGLCSKFNSISCDRTKDIRIPFTTFHTHQASLGSQNNTVHISENATNLKRVWSVYMDSTQSPAFGPVLPFRGCINDTAARQITKYNYRLGTKFLYNEPVEETINNNQTLGHVKHAVWSGDKPFMLSKSNAAYTRTLFEDSNNYMFMTVANMCYSPEETKGVVQGVSTSTPVELQVSFATSPAGSLMVNNFCEIGYDLVIKGGMIRYEEQKPGSQTVY
jgi:hypothetical protein